MTRLLYEYTLLGYTLDENFATHNDVVQFKMGFNFRIARDYSFIDVSHLFQMSAFLKPFQTFNGNAKKILTLLSTSRLSEPQHLINHLVFQPITLSPTESRFKSALIRYLQGVGHVNDPVMILLLRISDEEVEEAKMENVFRAKRFMRHATGTEIVPRGEWMITVSLKVSIKSEHCDNNSPD